MEQKIKYSARDYSVKTYNKMQEHQMIYVREDSALLAVSIYVFLMKLSAVTRHFIFRILVKDMLSYSRSFCEEDAIIQLSKALVTHMDRRIDSERLNLLYDCFCFKKSSSRKEVFLDSIKTKDYLKLSSLIAEIPSEDKFFSIFKAFEPSDMQWDDDSKFNELVQLIDKKLEKIRIQGLDTTTWKDANWSFTPLGFLSVFENWLYCEDAVNPYEFYFFQLYIKGKVLESVIGTVFRCDVQGIGSRIMKAIELTCERNVVFCEYVQKIYDGYRKIRSGIPEHIYLHKSDHNGEKVQALPYPCAKKTKKELTSEQFEKLYKQLQYEYIDCSIEDFKALFSGQTTNTITWKSDVNKLSALLKIYCDYQFELKFPGITERAQKIFVIKKLNYSHPGDTTLNQKPDTGALNGFERLFKSITQMG